ncbi:hypothetical protein LCGC14_1529520 [marine sediment metagenome]|uniref:Uncharacterized protein n=1 Tax=marine sediment metagenome TaxID=412755 RepID=A0A0F9JH17_9ZZZZ
MRPVFTNKMCYFMKSRGLLETLYILYSDELEIIDNPTFQNDLGWICYIHTDSGYLFTVVKAK